MTNCPHCGADRWRPDAEAYEIEVRKREPDLDLLASLAPPTRRASIHGFLLGILVWILILVPFFAPEGALMRDTGVALVLVVLWIWLFRRARKKDKALLAAYLERRRCLECGLRPGEG